MFSIEFTDEPLEYPYDDTSVSGAPGRLILGNSEEEFLANLSLWGKPDYQSHWKHELRLLLVGNPKVALVVSYADPKAASSMEIWRVFRDGEWAHFQNQLLSYSTLTDDFEISEIDRYIDDRTITNADGDRISEWDVAIQDIQLFLERSDEF